MKKVPMLLAAEIILRRSLKPLHSKEIIALALEAGLIDVKGKSPDRSLQSAIWRDINVHRKELSPFLMVGTGKKLRRYWLVRKAKSKATE
jgi:hypothetical protein